MFSLFFSVAPIGANGLVVSLLRTKILKNTMLQKQYHTVGTPLADGVALFNQAKITVLKTQMRIQDEEHAAWLERLRNPNNDCNPITPDDVKKFKNKIITDEDIKSNAEWNFATIIVKENVERSMINFERAKQLSKVLNEPLIAWLLPLKSLDTKEKMFLSTEAERVIGFANPHLMGLFLKGAGTIINQNIAPHNGLANGTECFYSSLTLQDDAEDIGEDDDEDIGDTQKSLSDSEKIKQAKGGDVVFLSQPPISVNVLLMEESSVSVFAWPKEDNLAQYILRDEGAADVTKNAQKREIVIPITPHCYRDKPIALWLPEVAGQDKVDGISNNDVKDLRSIHCMRVNYKRPMLELTLCRTFYKAQGSTLGRVILQLNHIPGGKLVTYKELYMAASRVTHGNNFKIMPLYNRRSLDYLREIKPDLDVLAYFDGIVDAPKDPQPWDQEKTAARVTQQLQWGVRARKDS